MKNSYPTPVDPDYRTCARTCVTLRINCGETSPRSVTAALGIEPSRIAEKGISGILSGNGTKAIGKLNIWMLKSDGLVQSLDLRDHLDWLLDRLDPLHAQLADLRQSGMTMDIPAVWWSKYGDGGPTLWPAQMRRIAFLDLELSIGFAYYDEGDE